MWIAPAVLGQPHLLFVRRGDILLRCSDASDRVAAALLGRFLPRLGPLGFLAALFFGICASVHDSAPTICDTDQGLPNGAVWPARRRLLLCSEGYYSAADR